MNDSIDRCMVKVFERFHANKHGEQLQSDFTGCVSITDEHMDTDVLVGQLLWLVERTTQMNIW
jgi:hypothetical protein